MEDLAKLADSVGVTYQREFEYREAARFGNYKWTEFKELPVSEQEATIAHYRTRGNIDAAVAERRKK